MFIQCQSLCLPVTPIPQVFAGVGQVPPTKRLREKGSPSLFPRRPQTASFLSLEASTVSLSTAVFAVLGDRWGVQGGERAACRPRLPIPSLRTVCTAINMYRSLSHMHAQTGGTRMQYTRVKCTLLHTHTHTYTFIISWRQRPLTLPVVQE